MKIGIIGIGCVGYAILQDFIDKGIDVISYDKYKDILFHTFWCSDEITIVAKEFYDGYFVFNRDKDKEKLLRESNRKRYEDGLIFLFECFKEIEKFTKKKLLIKSFLDYSKMYLDEETIVYDEMIHNDILVDS